MDLKNLKIDDIKAKILSMADKKTLIKFGIGIGSIVFFLIIYYSILNPIVQTKKVKLKEMMDKKIEIVEFEKEITEDKLRDVLKKSPGISVVDFRKDEGYVTPEECAGEDKVYVSRIRKDNTLKNAISLWVVADNLRKGAALNAIQIGEELIKKKFF